MIAADEVALVLLAAGSSTRFGAKDKLAEPIAGVPLALHAARMLGTFPFAAKIVVTREGGVDFAPFGFTPVVNPGPAVGQSNSIRLGVARAHDAEPKAILIALADMPFVTRAHIEALLARFETEHSIIASTGGRHATPPVLFGTVSFAALEALTGDAGARALLRHATLVTASPDELADIDTPADLPPL